MTADELASRLERVKKSGSGYVARCPAHQDKEPSLSVSTGDDGRVLLHCHVGCTPDAIVRALGLSLSDLFPPTETHQQREITQRYPYRDEHGQLLFEVVRLEAPGQGKTFRQRRPTPDGGWDWKLGDTRRVLYHLPELRAAINQGATVYVAEGEKDVHAIEQAGAAATCNPGGAGKWRPEYTTALLGAERVIVIADRDDTGLTHARVVHDALTEAGVPVEMRQARTGKDAHDHLAAGHTLDQLEPIAEPTPDHSWAPIPLDYDDEDEDEEPDRIIGLIYPGKRTLLAGEPDAGKSWLTLIAVLETIQAGQTAFYIDHEMNQREVRNRLRKLGATRDQLSRVIYIHPDEPLAGPARPDTITLLHKHQPTIVVVDAFASTLATHGLKENDNTDIETWYLTVGDTLRSTGAALVIIDHVTKDKESRGGFSIGGQRKKGAADVMLEFEVVKPFSRGKPGLAKVLVRKDRPGWLPRPKAAEIEFTSELDTGRATYKITLQARAQDDGDHAEEQRLKRPTHLMERVSRRLEEHAQEASRTWVEENVHGKREWVRTAIDVLVREGFLKTEQGARRAVLLTVQKPFREAWDTTPPDSARLRPDSAPGGVECDSAHPAPPSGGGERGAGAESAGSPGAVDPAPPVGSTEWLGQAPLEEIHAWDSRQRDPA